MFNTGTTRCGCIPQTTKWCHTKEYDTTFMYVTCYKTPEGVVCGTIQDFSNFLIIISSEHQLLMETSKAYEFYLKTSA